ncbi:MAG: hypothetical protein WC451_03680 [Patescibacteria group bacterium]
MSIEKAIEIAKKIDPAIGPSLEMDKKNMTEAQLSVKLRDFFDAYENAAKFKQAHPGKNNKELESMVAQNINAHVNNDFHVATFVASVLSKKGDLEALSLSAARRIVLSDPRIEIYFKANPSADKIKLSEKITAEIQKILMDYFLKFKGRAVDSEAISAELTVSVTKKIAELLNQK